jgi:hypothetical protein
MNVVVAIEIASHKLALFLPGEQCRVRYQVRWLPVRYATKSLAAEALAHIGSLHSLILASERFRILNVRLIDDHPFFCEKPL